MTPTTPTDTLHRSTPRWVRLCFGLLWLTFTTYAFLGAPAEDSQTVDLILQLSTGQWQGLNAWVVALFNAMGLWPIAFASLLLWDGHLRQGLPAWPFVMASFGLGAFAVLPYLVLRSPLPSQESSAPSALLKGLKSPWLWTGLAVGACLLLLYGWTQGDGSDFVVQWRSQRFIHVMTLDFCLLTLLFLFLVRTDLRRSDQA